MALCGPELQGRGIKAISGASNQKEWGRGPAGLLARAQMLAVLDKAR